jgi:hypothetical protein
MDNAQAAKRIQGKQVGHDKKQRSQHLERSRHLGLHVNGNATALQFWRHRARPVS